jgi:hypothetical protein
VGDSDDSVGAATTVNCAVSDVLVFVSVKVRSGFEPAVEELDVDIEAVTSVCPPLATFDTTEADRPDQLGKVSVTPSVVATLSTWITT